MIKEERIRRLEQELQEAKAAFRKEIHELKVILRRFGYRFEDNAEDLTWDDVIQALLKQDTRPLVRWKASGRPVPKE